MGLQRADTARQFARVMAARNGQVFLRLSMPVIIALIFHRFVGWGISVAWVASFAAMQALDHLVFPVSRVHDLMMRPAMRIAAMATIAASGLIFSSYAMIAVAVNNDVWHMTWAALLLTGVVMNTVLTSSGSRTLFITSMGPQVFYFLLLPALAYYKGAPIDHALALGAAGFLNLFAAVLAWRLFQKLLGAEQTAREAAESATEAKSAFIAMISHELRTPISAILAGAAEMESDADSTRRANGALIGDSARMMRTLLNDLLDLSKLEVGKMTVEAIPYDLAAVMRDAAHFWSGAARKKGLELRLAGPADDSIGVSGDPTRLRQILNNLLSNAIKFTDAGAVALRFELRAVGDAHVDLTIEVVDTGPGMTEAQQARLFTAFDQLGAATARTHGGTGLGLNISRQLARLMGGDLTAASRPGMGATFTLKLRLGRAVLGAAPQTAAPAAEAELSERLRVLVADDHQINRRAFSLMLETVGALVATVEDGQQALDLLARQEFDVVLMDLNMPRMGGLEATERLRRSNGPNRDAPIIALTASVTPGDVALCRSAGMNAFVMKPVDAAELFTAINAVLSPETDEEQAVA